MATPTRFLSIRDFDASQLEACLELAAELKQRARGRRAATSVRSKAQHIALLFEKPSLRTRSTFQIAVRELGGDVIEPPQDVALGGRETINDVARNLERWVHGAVVRTYAQARLEAFADAAPAAARRQRADRRRASVPGARRLPDDDRAVGIAARPDRSPTSATATTSRSRWRRRRRCSAPGCASRRLRATSCDPAAVAGIARAARLRRIASRSPTIRSPRCAAPTRSTRTSGRRWARSPRRSSARRSSRRYQVNGELMAHGARRRDVHALPAGASRRRGHRRGDRFGRVGRLRSVREPAAHAEGAARDARLRRASGLL